MGNLYFLLNFCGEPKTDLNKVYLKKRDREIESDMGLQLFLSMSFFTQHLL